jgi:hypothetical protein|tara:strand:- start:821 stop:1171 length:351 start_codon:yes stop_codon:yes gene_type:complete
MNSEQTILPEIEDIKKKWLSCEREKIPLKEKLKAINQCQRDFRKQLQSYMETTGLFTLQLSDEQVIELKTKQRVIYNEERLSEIIEDPSVLNEYKLANSVTCSRFIVKKRKIDDTN